MTIRFGSLVVTSALILAPASGSAQDSRFSIGLRSGYSHPFGTSGDGADLRDLTRGAMPFQVDLGYHLSPSWRLTLGLNAGPAFIADEAKRALQSQGLRSVGGHRQQALTLEVARSFRAGSTFSPWVGVSGGYEWTRYAAAKLPSGLETEIGRSGLTGALTLGGDLALSRRLSVGPYLSLDLGRHSRDLVWIEDGDEASTTIRDKGTHGWMKAGARLSLRF